MEKNEVEISAKVLKVTPKYKKLKKALLTQLKAKGADTPTFTDLVDDYMTLWITKELLRIDIEETGVKLAYNNGGGQSGYKENPSIEKFYKVNSQMLKILSELKIKTDSVGVEVEDEL